MALSRMKLGLALGCAAIGLMAAQPAFAQVRAFSVPAQDARQAIPQFARQAGIQISAPTGRLRGVRTRAVSGNLDVRAALRAMIEGTGLEVASDDGGMVVLRYGAASGEDEAGDVAADNRRLDAGATPDILVIGQRPTLNADIRRTEDDAQPYVVFSGNDITQSGAGTLDDFLLSRLPMNAQAARVVDSGTSSGNTGRIDLRGLGTAQTLILVDGRRLPAVGVNLPTGFGQPNLNGIPVAAIERIEVLPATSGGIYGGSATAGVINVILKRDYSGLDLLLSYGDTFDFDSSNSVVSLSGGLTLNQGHTQIMASASRSEQGALLAADRDFTRRARELAFRNNPSAFLGSPVLGYTPNICATATATSTTCTTNSLVLDNGTSLGSPLTSVPAGYLGPVTDGGAALAGNAGRINLGASANANQLRQSSVTEAVLLGVRQDFAPWLEGFVDISATRTRGSGIGQTPISLTIAANSPNNPFQQDIRVAFNVRDFPSVSGRKIEEIGARGGLIARLPGRWTASLEHGWSRNVNSFENASGFQLNAAGNSYLETIALRDPNVVPSALAPFITSFNRITSGPFEAALHDTILRFAGPLVRLGGGNLTTSGYLERTRATVGAGFSEFFGTTLVQWYPAKSQEVRSAYLEARAPIFSSTNAVPLIRELELMFALRYDDYESRAPLGNSSYFLGSRSAALPSISYVTNSFSSISYTIGARFAPTRDLTLRASFGTGFLPPNLGQISPAVQDVTFDLGLVDPRRGNTPLVLPYTSISGGNPNLLPEESESWSAGLILTPRFVDGLRISVDYTRIEKTNEIGSPPGLAQYWINNEARFPDRVVRGAVRPGDPAGWAGPIVQLDQSQANLRATAVEAWDFQLDYNLETRNAGNWRLYAIATLQTVLKRQATAEDSPIDSVGFSDGPVAWRANFGLTWNDGPWTAGWNAQYYDKQLLYNSLATVATCGAACLNQGAAYVPSQAYVDAFVTYRFDRAGGFLGGLLSNTEMTVAIQDLFDDDPPLVALTAAQTPGFSRFGDPRGRRFVLTLRTHLGR